MKKACLCFQIQPKQAGETEKDLVWIDPKTHITVQRYNYGRDGKLTKMFALHEPSAGRARHLCPDPR